MRPVTLILTLAVGLPLAATTTGCERERTRVVPAQKTIEKETTVIERDVDEPDVHLHPDTRTQPPAEPAAGPDVKTEVKVEDRDEHDGEMDVEDLDDVDVDVDTDTSDDKVKVKGSVKVDD